MYLKFSQVLEVTALYFSVPENALLFNEAEQNQVHVLQLLATEYTALTTFQVGRQFARNQVTVRDAVAWVKVNAAKSNLRLSREVAVLRGFLKRLEQRQRRNAAKTRQMPVRLMAAA